VFSVVQLTIEIPDELARQLSGKGKDVAELIQRGLTQSLSDESVLAEEVIQFLGRGPGAEEIIGFRPSPESVSRAEELLEKNRGGGLSARERMEIDEICAWNRLFALIKAQARLHLQGAR